MKPCWIPQLYTYWTSYLTSRVVWSVRTLNELLESVLKEMCVFEVWTKAYDFLNKSLPNASSFHTVTQRIIRTSVIALHYCTKCWLIVCHVTRCHNANWSSAVPTVSRSTICQTLYKEPIQSVQPPTNKPVTIVRHINATRNQVDNSRTTGSFTIVTSPPLVCIICTRVCSHYQYFNWNHHSWRTHSFWWRAWRSLEFTGNL